LSVFRENFIKSEASALWQMIDYQKVALFAVLVFLVFKFKKHPLVYIAIGAATGILLGWGA